MRRRGAWLRCPVASYALVCAAAATRFSALGSLSHRAAWERAERTARRGSIITIPNGREASENARMASAKNFQNHRLIRAQNHAFVARSGNLMTKSENMDKFQKIALITIDPKVHVHMRTQVFENTFHAIDANSAQA